jgi:hypothetical protein
MWVFVFGVDRRFWAIYFVWQDFGVCFGINFYGFVCRLGCCSNGYWLVIERVFMVVGGLLYGL